MTKDLLLINRFYGDPVDNPTIRQDGMVDGFKYNKPSESYNPIIGYYGPVRVDSGKPLKHSGFDYLAPIGTEVKAVHSGTVTKVRIGRYGTEKTCELRRWFVENHTQPTKESCQLTPSPNLMELLEYSNQKEKCNTCPFRKDPSGKCFGMQLWLKVSDYVDDYAFYAHLSGLEEKIWNLIKSKVNDKTFDYVVDLKVERGVILGYSGCTGNASVMEPYQEHLHFEYRTGTAEAGTDRNPNDIVKTKFYLNEVGVHELSKSILKEREQFKMVKNLYEENHLSEDGLYMILDNFDRLKPYYIRKKEEEFSSYV